MADVDIVLPSNVPEGNHFVKLVKGEGKRRPRFPAKLL